MTRFSNIPQLIGYAFLDYDDHFGIQNIALYSAQFPALLQWSLPDAVAMMSDGKVTVPAMRAAVRSLMAR
jgi:hypothetical protein